MKQAFNKYVKGILCSFLRIASSDELYYLVTFNYSGDVRNCRVQKDKINGWSIDNETAIKSPYLFFKELIGAIEQNEQPITPAM